MQQMASVNSSFGWPTSANSRSISPFFTQLSTETLESFPKLILSLSIRPTTPERVFVRVL